MRGLSVMMFVGAVVSVIKGFHKMYAYELGSIVRESVNAYVEGDAYNYIINGTHATVYFILFGALFIGGILIEMLIAYNSNHKKSPENNEAIENK